jgi:exonuclease SbcC
VHPEDFASHRTEAASSAQRARDRLAKAEADRAKVEEERKARERYERAHERWKEVEKRRSATRAAHERARKSVTSATLEVKEARSASEAARTRVSQLLPEESRATAARAEVARLEGIRADRARDVERSLLSVERRQGIDRALAALNAETERVRQEGTALERRLAERGERARALRAKLPDMDSLRRSLDEVSRRLSTAREEEAEERALLSRLDAQLDEALRRVRDAEVGRQERSALLAEAKDAEEKAGWVGGAFRTAVLEMEQKLLTHAQALFEREFARYFASLVDDPGLVARTDPAFTPLVMIEGEWTPAEALSGGERTSLALAFRLALAHVVRSMGSLHLDTILLDEPTDGFSPEQVIRMGELLEELALPQVILVSHESQLAAIADRVVRVQKVDGRSVLTTNGLGGKGGRPELESVDSSIL